MKKLKYRFLAAGMLLVLGLSGCGSQSADHKTVSEEVETTASADSLEATPTEEVSVSYVPVNENAITKGTAIYDCDIEADKAAYDGEVDIVVGDNLYATQINDWYENFKDYEGKIVEIEGYYITDYDPYLFVGRFGPSCPYCVGSYVSFEVLTEDDLSTLESGTDWIKVTGILREGNDSASGAFYYIEALDIEVMDEAGQDTVTN